VNKEEILKKSCEQREDEGAVYADNKGRRYGYIAFGFLYVIIKLFGLFTKQNNYAADSMFFAYIAAEAYGKYRITKAKSMVVLTVLGAIASILTLDRYVTNILCIGA